MKTNIKNRVVCGNWNSPREWLSNHKSVLMADYYDQTSSAGDWSGYFVQKIGGKYGLFLFSQENRWPLGGYNLNINENTIGFCFEKPNKKTVELFIINYLEL